MAEEKVDKVEKRRTAEYEWFNKPELFRAFHYAIMGGKPHRSAYLHWCGEIVLNRDQVVHVTDSLSRRPVAISIKAMTPTKINRLILEQLILRAIQDGPANMTFTWEPDNGIPRSMADVDEKNRYEPLKIHILSESIDGSYVAQFGDVVEQKRGGVYRV